MRGLIAHCLLALLLCGCGASSTPTGPSQTGISLAVIGPTSLNTSSTSTPTTAQLIATARFSNGTSEDITAQATWESRNRSVATVSSSGVLTAHSNGEVEIVATYREGRATLHVSIARGEPFPAEMADMLGKLRIPNGVCLKYDSGSGPSTYAPPTNTVTIRQDSNPFGDLARMAHELGHAHQDWLAESLGSSNIGSWVLTQEGEAYLQAGCWTRVASCAPDSNDPACWTQDMACCERNFCKVLTPSGGFIIPLEENADFIGTWYNAGKVPGWGADFNRTAPRRAAWARNLAAINPTRWRGSDPNVGESAFH